MITYFTKKIWIFRPFKRPGCYERILCEQHIISSYQTQSGILQGVQYLTSSLHYLEICVHL